MRMEVLSAAQCIGSLTIASKRTAEHAFFRRGMLDTDDLGTYAAGVPFALAWEHTLWAWHSLRGNFSSACCLFISVHCFLLPVCRGWISPQREIDGTLFQISGEHAYEHTTPILPPVRGISWKLTSFRIQNVSFYSVAESRKILFF